LLEATYLPVEFLAARCGLGHRSQPRLHLARDAGATPTPTGRVPDARRTLASRILHTRQSCHWPPSRHRSSIERVHGCRAQHEAQFITHPPAAGRVPVESGDPDARKALSLSNIAPLLDPNRAFADDPAARHDMAQAPVHPN